MLVVKKSHRKWILECSLPRAVIKERLHKRRSFGSLFHGEDAIAELVEKKFRAQIAGLDPLDEQERRVTVTVDTGKPVDHRALANRMHELDRAEADQGAKPGLGPRAMCLA